MVTTEGSTLSATEVTAQPTSELAEVLLPLLPLLLPEDEQPASAAPAATGKTSQGSQRRWPTWRLVTRSPSGPSRSESAVESPAAPRARWPGTLTSPAVSSSMSEAVERTACRKANAPNISIRPITMNQTPIKIASAVMDAIGAEITTIPATRLMTPKKIDQPVPILVAVPEKPAISAARP